MSRLGRPPFADIDAADRRRAAELSRAYRRAHRLTQRQLAKQLGIFASQISLVENRNPGARTRSVAALLSLQEPATA